MNLLDNLFIFSVYQSSESESVNRLNHEFIFNALKSRGLPVKVVQGCYNGQTELSIIVVGLQFESIVRDYCLAFNQESYLKRHNDGHAELYFLSGGQKSLGMFKSVRNIMNYDSYTYDPTTGQYFICT